LTFIAEWIKVIWGPKNNVFDGSPNPPQRQRGRERKFCPLYNTGMVVVCGNPVCPGDSWDPRLRSPDQTIARESAL